MPDFTLLHPDTGEQFVVGAADRARLLSRGYRDKLTDPPSDAQAPVDPATPPPAVAAEPAAPTTPPVPSPPVPSTSGPKSKAGSKPPADTGDKTA